MKYFLSCVVLFLYAPEISNAGNYQYEFISSGEVFATLDLSKMPANHLDVLSLSFTELGENALGFGPTYTGDFDVSDGLLEDSFGSLDGNNSDLSFTAYVADTDPPVSDLPRLEGSSLATFTLSAGSIDLLLFEFNDVNNAGHEIRIVGNWKAIPEPRCSSLFLLGAAILLASRRPQKPNI